MNYTSWFLGEWRGFDYLNLWRSYLNGYHWGYTIVTDAEHLIRGYWGDRPSKAEDLVTLLMITRILLLTVAVIGAWHARAHRGLQAAVASYLVLLLAWPYPLGYRALLPVLPLAVLWFIGGARVLPGACRKLVLGAGLVFFVGALGINLVMAPSIRLQYDQSDVIADCEGTARFIREHIPPTARLADNFHNGALFDLLYRCDHPIVYAQSLPAAFMDGRCDFAVGDASALEALQQADKTLRMAGREIKIVYHQKYLIVFENVI